MTDDEDPKEKFASEIIHGAERDENQDSLQNMLVQFLNSGLPLAIGLALVAFTFGFLAALSVVAINTTFYWDTILALNEWEPIKTVAYTGGIGLLALGIGLGWQWRRNYDTENDQ